MTVKTNLSINQRLEVQEVGDFIRILELPGIVDVEFYRRGVKVKVAKAVGEGFAETFIEEAFDRVVIVNGGAVQEIQYVIRFQSRVAYDKPPSGDVNVLGGVSTSQEAAGLLGKTFSVVGGAETTAASRTSIAYVRNPAGSGKVIRMEVARLLGSMANISSATFAKAQYATSPAGGAVGSCGAVGGPSVARIGGVTDAAAIVNNAAFEAALAMTGVQFYAGIGQAGPSAADAFEPRAVGKGLVYLAPGEMFYLWVNTSAASKLSYELAWSEF